MIHLKLNMDQMSLVTDEAKYDKLSLGDEATVLSDGKYFLSYTDTEYNVPDGHILALENSVNLDADGYSHYVISPFLGCDSAMSVTEVDAATGPENIELECNLGYNFF